MTLATGAAATTGGGGLSLIILALPILLLLWLMFSQRRRTKALNDAQQALQVGQEVMTTSGIHGVVSGLEHEVVHLRIAEGVVVRFDRRAIVPMSLASRGPAGPGGPGGQPGAGGQPGTDGQGGTGETGGTGPR